MTDEAATFFYFFFNREQAKAVIKFKGLSSPMLLATPPPSRPPSQLLRYFVVRAEQVQGRGVDLNSGGHESLVDGTRPVHDTDVIDGDVALVAVLCDPFEGNLKGERERKKNG